MKVAEISERAQRVHKEAIVVDGVQAWRLPELEYLSPEENIERWRNVLKKVIKGGFTAINMTVTKREQDPGEAALETAKFLKQVEGCPEEAKIAVTAADIENAKREGKVALIMGMQGCRAYEDDLDLIRIFYKLGYRILQPSYSKQTYLSSGCAEPVDSGLTRLGKEYVKELNRLGILLDVTHCSDKTVIEAAELSKAPIALTHSCSRTFLEHLRARSDEAIKAVADKGGVIGQNFERPFCESKEKRGRRPTISDITDLVDYLVKLVGVDHVGFATDWCPFWTAEGKQWAIWMQKFADMVYPYTYYHSWDEMWPEAFGKDMAGIVAFTEELLRRGYSESETKKIIGGNWLRLIKEVIG